MLVAVRGPVAAGAAPVAPTYKSYPIGITGGEPSIGWDYVRNVGMYGELLVRRLKWDNPVLGGAPQITAVDPATFVSLDPITIVDPYTSRTFTSQLLGACSHTYLSDDAGASWTPTQGCGAGTLLDHQSLGAGPFHAPLPTPPAPAYPGAVYYCAQNGFNGACAVSLDGGLTYGQGVPVANTPLNDPTDPNPTFAAEGGACSALFGHVRVDPLGNAYLPLKGCGGQFTSNNGTNTEYFGGQPSLSVSSDNGTTWSIHRVPATQVPNGLGGTNLVENPDESDPSVGISRKGGVLYFGWGNGHNPSDLKNGDQTQAMVAVSHDHGNTWSPPVDVSSRLGLHNVQFPEVIAGDDDRAAFAFVATTTIGDDQTNAFTAMVPKPFWHLYVATTYDGGATWTTVDATPNKPVQRGCIDLQGTTIPPSARVDPCNSSQRNLLDFNDITVDNDGRVLVAYTDGCLDKCITDPTHDHPTDGDMVLRQASGVGLFAIPVRAGGPGPAPTVPPVAVGSGSNPNTSARPPVARVVPIVLVLALILVATVRRVATLRRRLAALALPPSR
jgi:hypothetical protein